MIRIDVHDQSAVSKARQTAAQVAGGCGLPAGDAARLALVVTEACTNLLKHGGGGELLLDAVGGGAAVQMLALDKGRGMDNVQECLRDGHSTAGSPGTGLGAMQRQSELFEIYSGRGRGTVVLARIGRAADDGPYLTGAVRLPKAGEAACGDAWCERRLPDGRLVMLCDGLGHGPLAASAAQEAVRVFQSAPEVEPVRLLDRIHHGIRATRGAAAAVARIDGDRLWYAGIGNIAGTILTGAERRGLVSMAGIVGHQARRFQQFEYELPAGAVLVMNSDGLVTAWDLADYPGLMGRHPAIVAGVLYRDFSRDRDDVTVVVVTRRPS